MNKNHYIQIAFFLSNVYGIFVKIDAIKRHVALNLCLNMSKRFAIDLLNMQTNDFTCTGGEHN